MCKFNKPMIPADATEDDRRSLIFNALYSTDLSEETEKKANLTYISWSQAWKVFKMFYPSATYKIFTNPNTGLPVFESEMGLMVHTSVQADGIEYEDWLPVMDYNNRAMKSIPYTIQVYDKQSKQYIEKRIEAATTFDCNSAIQRSMVRAIARHGLGLYIYNGFEHICDDSEQPTNNVTTQQKGNVNQPVQRQQNNTRSQVKPVQTPVKDETATIKEEIIAAKDVTSLVSLYLDYTEAIESNPELKNLLTNRKKALKTLNS